MKISLSTKEILYIIDAMDSQWSNPKKKKKRITILKKRIGGFDGELWERCSLYTNLREKLLGMLESAKGTRDEKKKEY